MGNMEQRINRIYDALARLGNGNLAGIKPQFSNFSSGVQMVVDFNCNSTEAELENATQILITNIASIRDHLKEWCEQKNTDFKGDSLINTNRSVALVHDLWNIDKHAKLDRKPRSGVIPSLRELRRSLVLTTGTAAGSAVSFSMDMDGNQSIQTENGGSAKLEIVGRVVDQNGKDLGDFRTICEAAIDAWWAELATSGVPLAVLA